MRKRCCTFLSRPCSKIVSFLSVSLAVEIAYGDKIIVLVRRYLEIVHRPRFALIESCDAIKLAHAVLVRCLQGGINGMSVCGYDFEPAALAQNFVGGDSGIVAVLEFFCVVGNTLLSYVYAVFRKRPIDNGKDCHNAQNYDERKGHETTNKQRKKTRVVYARR